MALSDLSVFSQFAYLAATEIVDQQIQLFNAASDGVLVLSMGANQGPYSDEVSFGNVANMVRTRDPAGTGSLASKAMRHIDETRVKVAKGTYPIDLSPAQFRWIKQDPKLAGAAMGKQLSAQMLQQMLNNAIGVVDAAISGQSALKLDVSANSEDAATGSSAYPTPVNLTAGAGLFGDRAGSIRAWLMHSDSMTKLWKNALVNNERLFTYGAVNVMRDPFGRLYVVTDAPNLVVTGSPNKYHTLGLVPGAVTIEEYGDYDEVWDDRAGKENISRLYQAEWSYNVGVKGFTWDKSNGGTAPNDAALYTSTNWDLVSASIKDTAGVCIVTK